MDIKLLDRKGVYINAIDAHSVMREQVDGGQDTLTFKTSWRPIEKGSRVVVQLPTLDWQEYVVTGLIETAEAVEVSCEHAIYDMFGEFIEDLRPTGTPDYLLDVALQSSRWKRLGSSVAGSYSTNFYRISVREAVSKIQELTGLVLRYKVAVAGSQITNRWCWWELPGANNRGFRFEGGFNAERIERRTDESQLITSLYGFGRGQYDAETGGYGRRVDFAAINGGLQYVENASAVAAYGRQIFGKIEFDDTEDPAEVLARTQAELAMRSVPQVSYSGTVYDLGFDDSVSIGETVMLQTSDVMNVRVLGRVLRLVSYLDRSRANQIEVGNYNNIYKPVQTQRTLNQIREQLATDPTRGGLESVNSKIVSDLLANFNTQINDGILTGTVTALPGGFIFESEDGATHIGPDGWRVANTKNPDGSWVFTTLATGDGLAAGIVGADQIIAGSITTDHISASGISAESIYIGESTTTVQDKINEFDALEIGGRNLLKTSSLSPVGIGSTKEFALSGWASELVNNTETLSMLTTGQEYTISFDMELIERTTPPTLYASLAGLFLYSASTANNVPFYTNELVNLGDRQHYSETFICPELTDQRIIYYTNRYTTNGGDPYGFDKVKFTNVKLEKGNKSTDWTPALEDVAAEIVSEAADVQRKAEQAAADYADALLNDEIVRADAYADNVLTLAEQEAVAKADAALSEASSNLIKADESLRAFVQEHVSAEMSELKTYIRTDPVNGNLLIGAPGSRSMLRQSNLQMTFEYNGVPVAYFGAGETDMPKAGVDTELRIGDKTGGNYYWVSDADGGMSLVWK